MLPIESLRAEIPKRLREKRLSQVELSRRTGIDQTVISLYVCNRRTPKVAVLEKLAAGIGYRFGMVDSLQDAEEATK